MVTRLTDRFGTWPARSRRLSILRSANAWALNAVMAMGVSCRFVARRSAVTISSSTAFASVTAAWTLWAAAEPDHAAMLAVRAADPSSARRREVFSKIDFILTPRGVTVAFNSLCLLSATNIS
jgi:hypothetical protein